MPGANHPDLTSLLERVERLEAELSLARAEIKRKDRIIEGLRQRIFGASSEKLDPAQLQLMFDEVVLGKPAPSPDQSAGETSAPEGEKSNAVRTRRTKADRFPKNLRIVVEDVIIADEVLANPDLYEEISEDYHDELDAIKSEMIWRRKIIKKHVLKSDKTRPPVTAPAPPPSIPGTMCAPALAAQIAVDKIEDHLPHYRQSRRIKRKHEIDLGRQTLNSWFHATAGHLHPLGPAMKAEVLGTSDLQIDETPIDYLCPGRGSTKEGRLWVYRNAVSGTCYFDWQPGRGLDCLLDFLGYDKDSHTIGYAGRIQCDGYSVYDALAKRFEGIRLLGCLAHIRRKFMEAGEESPEVTVPVLLFIQQIYHIETQARWTTAPPACLELIRRSRSRLIADQLHRFLVARRKDHLPHGALGEAITYALNQWDKFMACLGQGVLDVDNNKLENLIRPAKLGMRNYLFFGSLEAGANNALFYSLLANCRVHGLEPEAYLTEVIKRLPHNATVEQAAELTPARFAAALRGQAQQVA